MRTNDTVCKVNIKDTIFYFQLTITTTETLQLISQLI